MGKKPPRVLTNLTNVKESDISPLTNVQAQPFRISIERGLENKFQFGDMKQSDIKDFHRFVSETVGKSLSISQVDNMYLRKRGLKKDMTMQVIDGAEREVFHYGKDRHPFRLFGFYNTGYFVLTKIDCTHATHK